MAKTIFQYSLFASLLLCVHVSVAAGSVQKILDLEEQLTAALSHSDADVVDTLWDDDLVWIGINGKSYSRMERLAVMKSPGRAASNLATTNKHVDVRIYGQTAVVTVQSVWASHTELGDTSTDYIATHVWHRQSGKWRLISAHISKLVE